MLYVFISLIALFLPGFLVLAACMLSSRISHARRAPKPGHALPDEYRPEAQGNP